jgi:AcrR family transcriptional regulator
MTVRESIVQKFRECVVAIPWDEITITLICQKTNVSRAAFYTYFHSKEAVARQTVEDDLLKPQIQMRETINTTKFKSAAAMLTELIYLKIRENRQFYCRINAVDGGNLLRSAITDAFIRLNNAVFKDYDIPDDEKRLSAFFFSAANAALISKWLSDGLTDEPSRLAHLYIKWTQDYYRKVTPHIMDWM